MEPAKRHARDSFKPGVDKQVLLFLAGVLWIGVGVMLLGFSWQWLRAAPDASRLALGGTGAALALIVHHFGFLRVVDRNLGRILPMQGKRCVFSFLSWKSYLTVGVMVVLGVALRHSPIPKPYLSVLYTGIGLALILSSVRYLRVLLTRGRRASGPPE